MCCLGNPPAAAFPPHTIITCLSAASPSLQPLIYFYLQHLLAASWCRIRAAADQVYTQQQHKARSGTALPLISHPSMASAGSPAGTSTSSAADGGLAAAGGAAVSEETKRKVAAAKSYIENMYKVQHQNIQERYARYGQQQQN